MLDVWPQGSLGSIVAGGIGTLALMFQGAVKKPGRIVKRAIDHLLFALLASSRLGLLS